MNDDKRSVNVINAGHCEDYSALNRVTNVINAGSVIMSKFNNFIIDSSKGAITKISALAGFGNLNLLTLGKFNCDYPALKRLDHGDVRRARSRLQRSLEREIISTVLSRTKIRTTPPSWR